jgi:hypothetical protein
VANYKTSVSKSTNKKIMLPERLKDNDVKIELTQQQARDLIDYIFYKFHNEWVPVVDEPVRNRLLEIRQYLKKKLF